MRMVKVSIMLVAWSVFGILWLYFVGLTANPGLSAIQVSQIYDEGSFTALCLIAVLLATMFGLSGGGEQ